MKDKLLPCPFCGSEARLIVVSNSYGGHPVHITKEFKVNCANCGVSGRTFNSDIWQEDSGEVIVKQNGAADAIEAWNRRVEKQEDEDDGR